MKKGRRRRDENYQMEKEGIRVRKIEPASLMEYFWLDAQVCRSAHFFRDAFLLLCAAIPVETFFID